MVDINKEQNFIYREIELVTHQFIHIFVHFWLIFFYNIPFGFSSFGIILAWYLKV